MCTWPKRGLINALIHVYMAITWSDKCFDTCVHGHSVV